jgi:hypothetical protein
LSYFGVALLVSTLGVDESALALASASAFNFALSFFF